LFSCSDFFLRGLLTSSLFPGRNGAFFGSRNGIGTGPGGFLFDSDPKTVSGNGANPSFSDQGLFPTGSSLGKCDREHSTRVQGGTAPATMLGVTGTVAKRTEPTDPVAGQQKFSEKV
jgi:hypothetical protein